MSIIIIYRNLWVCFHTNRVKHCSKLDRKTWCVTSTTKKHFDFTLVFNAQMYYRRGQAVKILKTNIVKKEVKKDTVAGNILRGTFYIHLAAMPLS